MLSIASPHFVAVILLAGFLPGAKADCWVDDRYVYQSTTYPRPSHSAQLNPPHLFLNLRNGVETCDGLSNLARAMIGLAFCTYHPIDPHHKIPPRYLHLFITPTNTNSNFPNYPNLGRPPHHNPISPRLPRRDLQLVRFSQAAQPPSQSSLHPTDSAGSRRRGLRQSLQRSGRSTPVPAAVPTSDAQWPQLPIQLRYLFRLCSGARTFLSLLFPLLTLVLL
jgi:hypothetical protein